MTRVVRLCFFSSILIGCSVEKGEVVFDKVGDREMQIYLPPGYDPVKTYSVAYFHDGQNLFDEETAFAGEWRIDEVMDSLILADRMEPMVVVGLYNGGSKRAEEYVPYNDRQLLQYVSSWNGAAHILYEEFLLNEVIPYVEEKYNVSTDRLDRGIFGSSLGGLNALWFGMNNAGNFSFVGAISPSLWVGEGAILREFRTYDSIPDLKIWIDQGSEEWDKRALRLVSILKDRGSSYGEDLWYFEHNNANHNEKAWSERIAMPLLLFKGKNTSPESRLDAEIVYAYRSWQQGTTIDVRVNPMEKREDGIRYSLLDEVSYEVNGCVVDNFGTLSDCREDVVSIQLSYKDQSGSLELDRGEMEKTKSLLVAND